MGMAAGIPEPRNPYRLANGLMYCEWCPCTYSRGSDETGHWSSCRSLNPRGSTMPPQYRSIADIPDDVCPQCRRKEESNEYSGEKK